MTSRSRRALLWLSMLLMVLLAAAGTALWWLQRDLPLSTPRVELSIEPGTPAREVARAWVAAGVEVSPELLYQWFKWSGQARKIRAGSYEIETGVSASGLLDRMVRGDQTLETLRLIDGWTLRQVREALGRAPHLRHTVASLNDTDLAAAVGHPGGRLEGWLFPDTYAYSRGVSDVTVLRRAYQAMQGKLALAWDSRAPGLSLTEPGQLLVLASIVEKETGAPGDRGMIAGVFANRLRIGMPLQSDPTVIYGLGPRFDGNLRRSDLLTDHPWNTYTRSGLPPTPIGLPGLESMRAAARPEATGALYFVARGDGSSVFSNNLADHNRAVNQYQRGRRP